MTNSTDQLFERKWQPTKRRANHKKDIRKSNSKPFKKSEKSRANHKNKHKKKHGPRALETRKNTLRKCMFVAFSGVCGLIVLLLVLFSWFARTFSRVFFVVCSWFFWFFLKVCSCFFWYPFCGLLVLLWVAIFFQLVSWVCHVSVLTICDLHRYGLLSKRTSFSSLFSCTF